jgi:hypothetical protein
LYPACVFGQQRKVLHLIGLRGKVLKLRHIVDIIAIFIVVAADHELGLLGSKPNFGEDSGLERWAGLAKARGEARSYCKTLRKTIMKQAI